MPQNLALGGIALALGHATFAGASGAPAEDEVDEALLTVNTIIHDAASAKVHSWTPVHALQVLILRVDVFCATRCVRMTVKRIFTTCCVVCGYGTRLRTGKAHHYKPYNCTLTERLVMVAAWAAY